MSKADRKEILDLLAAGKITAAEAADLLSGATEKQPEPVVVEETPVSVDALKAQETAVAPVKKNNGKKPNWLHVRVSNMETGKNKVTVNIPLNIVNFGLKMGSKFNSTLQDLDLDMITNSEAGIIVDVQDEESNEHVQIYVD